VASLVIGRDSASLLSERRRKIYRGENKKPKKINVPGKTLGGGQEAKRDSYWRRCRP